MSADDLNETLAGMQAKTDAATPGEWGAFQRVADGAEFSLDSVMDTTTSSVECITDLRAEDGVGRMVITVADPVVSAADAEFIVMARSAMPALLSAVQGVLALCDEAEKDIIYPALVDADRIREALTDALGTESSNTGSEQ